MRPPDFTEQLDEYLESLKKKSSNKLVCPSASGKMMTETSWRTGWKSYQLAVDRQIRIANGEKLKDKCSPDNEIKMPEMTPHMLRHSFCTNLHYADVPIKVAQAIMGHADPRTTLKIYTHGDANTAMKEAAKKLSEKQKNF